MRWNRWYALKSYVLSALWRAPLIAIVLAQATLWGVRALQLDFGGIPGFSFDDEGIVAAMDTNITAGLSYLVFAFGSLLVAIQVSSAQLTPRIIATTLLRDHVIRSIVGRSEERRVGEE